MAYRRTRGKWLAEFDFLAALVVFLSGGFERMELTAVPVKVRRRR